MEWSGGGKMKTIVLGVAFVLLLPVTTFAGELAEIMKTINGSARILRGQIEDPAENRSSIAEVRKIQVASLQGTYLVPGNIENLDPKDRAILLNKYRNAMNEMADIAGMMDAALQDKRNRYASILFGALFQLRNDMHGIFKEQDE
jgi:hypothetical protein